VLLLRTVTRCLLPATKTDKRFWSLGVPILEGSPEGWPAAVKREDGDTVARITRLAAGRTILAPQPLAESLAAARRPGVGQ
jgi:hypothetical protein